MTVEVHVKVGATCGQFACTREVSAETFPRCGWLRAAADDVGAARVDRDPQRTTIRGEHT